MPQGEDRLFPNSNLFGYDWIIKVGRTYYGYSPCSAINTGDSLTTVTLTGDLAGDNMGGK